MSKFKVGDKVKLIVNVGPLKSDGYRNGVEKGDILVCVDKREPLDGFHLGNGEVSVVWANDYKSYFEENTQMKKSDLKSGMRIVHGKHDRHEDQFAIVVVDTGKIFFADGGWNYLDSYEEDLTRGSGVWDITEVYDAPDHGMLNFDVKGDLLWKRETKTPEQIQLDKITAQIAELSDQADKLQSLMKNK